MENKNREDTEGLLSDEILTDARRRADRLIKRSERDGKRVVEAALKEAGSFRERVLKRADERVEREKQVFDSALALEGRMRKLKMQGALLDEVFDAALKRLRERGAFDYQQAVKAFAVEAVLAMTGDALVLHLAEPDRQSMKDTLPEEVVSAVRRATGREVTLTVAADASPIDGGVVVESTDGVRHFDNSIAGRLRRMKDDLRFEIAERIFGAVDDAEAPAKEAQP